MIVEAEVGKGKTHHTAEHCGWKAERERVVKQRFSEADGGLGEKRGKH